MRTFTLLLLGAASCAISQGAVCSLTQNLQTVRSEGLTERLGDMRLTCSGFAPLQALTGSLTVYIGVPLTNRDLGENLIDLRLSILQGATFVPVANTAFRSNSAMATFTGLNLQFDPAGSMSLLISNIRAPGRTSVQAALAFNGSPALPLPTGSTVILSNPVPSLLAAYSQAVPVYSNELPASIDFNTLIALGLPHIATRITEGTAAAFEVKSASTDTGSRIIVRYRNVPAAARVIVPDYIVGRPSFNPTSAGEFGTVVNAGVYVARPNGALLLSRVRSSDVNGAGGTVLAFTAPGPVGDADRYLDFCQAVYEVINTDVAALETAQIPAFLWIPPGAPITDLIRQSVTYGPLSAVTTVSDTAPIPRFDPSTAPLDCGGVGDCNASYFPRLTTAAGSSLDLDAPQGGGPYTAFLTVKNEGGSVLEWNTTVNYLDDSGWLSVKPAYGYNDGTIALGVTPAFRGTGKYRATVTVSAPSPATPATYTVTMNVKPPVAVTSPDPAIITSVLNAASRYEFPISPDSLAVVTGGDFTANTSIVIGGQSATIVGGTAKEITVYVPPGLPIGLTQILAYKGATVSNAYGVQIAEIAPAVFGTLNADSSRNSDSNPAAAGSYIQVFGTGIPEANRPWIARIHDRWIDAPEFAGITPGTKGMNQFNFKVPDDFPTMQTEVQICGTPAAAPRTPNCSLGFKVWVMAKTP